MIIQNSYLRNTIKALLITVIFWAAPVYSAEQAETERLIRRMAPPLAIIKEAPAKDEIYLDAYYEPSDILQGSRTGHWSESTETFGYNHRNIRGYASISRYDRFDDKDFTANIGTYISLPNSYIHGEAGFGWYIDYMYNFQSIVEYGHKLYKGLFWQVGYTYRNYESGDTHLVYPGLIYYFGDNYIAANYGASFIESRDTASFGTVKGDFAITEFLRAYAGVAFGERLYDIFGLDAHEENGFILFTGFNIKIYKGISTRIGYSYSEEEPKFIKRSINFAATVKF